MMIIVLEAGDGDLAEPGQLTTGPANAGFDGFIRTDKARVPAGETANG